MTIESKTVHCTCSAQKLYTFLSDFNNFTRLIPSQVEGWTVQDDTCSFKVGGFVQLTLAYAERTPYTRVAVAPAANSSTSVPFKAYVDLKDNADESTQCTVVFQVDGNPMMTAMLKPKLRTAADALAERLQYFSSGL